jgi:hypothetical protein
VHIPRLPDWLVYATVVLAILFASLGRREKANAPPAPPPVPGAAQMPIDPSSPFASARITPVSRTAAMIAGTAFSVGDDGVWLTARRVITGCRQAAIVVAPGRSIAARPRAGAGDIAVLTTQGGAPALPLSFAADPQPAALAFHPGFPHGAPGEAASRLLGVQTVRPRERALPREQQLAWAEVGRTDGLKGALWGLLGAPALDGDGRVIGVTLAEAPRRGRLYTTTPDAMRQALAVAGEQPPPPGAGQAVTTDNYGRVADSLRLSLSVAQVVCLAV